MTDQTSNDQKTIFLEKLKYSLYQKFSRESIESAYVDEEVFAAISDIIIVSVGGFIWGNEIGKETIEYPSDWWQAFKKRWFPEWALKKWPVSYVVHQIKYYETYPDYHPSLPEEQFGKCKIRMINNRCDYVHKS
jgi:hypothetical protein